MGTVRPVGHACSTRGCRVVRSRFQVGTRFCCCLLVLVQDTAFWVIGTRYLHIPALPEERGRDTEVKIKCLMAQHRSTLHDGQAMCMVIVGTCKELYTASFGGGGQG